MVLSDYYSDALLEDEELADQIWDLWNSGVITGDLAVRAWQRIVGGERPFQSNWDAEPDNWH